MNPHDLLMAGNEHIAESMTVFSMMIPFVPIICMIIAFVFSVRLLNGIKPGDVCDLDNGCYRCDLLYNMSAGVAFFSVIYLMLEIAALFRGIPMFAHITHTFNCLSIMLVKSSVFLFMAYICKKGKTCLVANCLHKKKKSESKSQKKSSFPAIGDSIISECGAMCYPCEQEKLKGWHTLLGNKHTGKQNPCTHMSKRGSSSVSHSRQ